MTQQMMTALIAASGALLLAAVAWLTAKVQANTVAVQTHQNVLSALTRKVGTRIEGGAATGAGAVSGRVTPLWNQLNDPGSTGMLPGQRFNDCGEECCAEVIYRCHGVEVQADALRAQLVGFTASGVTDGQALVKLLGRNNVAAAAESVPAAAVATRLQAILAGGGQAIVLGNFVAPTVLHWVLVTRADQKGLGANDPWGGVRRVWTWQEFMVPYAGELVAVTQAPDI
jgi:hypothetical protein